MNPNQNNKQQNSDSSIQFDPQQLKKIIERQNKLDQERQNQIRRQKQEEQRQRYQQRRQRSRDVKNQKNRNNRNIIFQDNQKLTYQNNKSQNITWDIYPDVGQIDYSHSLPQKLKSLPILKKKNEIINKMINNQIILIVGDTGCGKSTQVPRLIYQYLKKINSSDKIICVQPRRLAVTLLKSSVEKQIIQKIDKVVGYQIGMKAQFNSNSRIVFMTNGIFLQRIVHDTSFLNQYPFIVLDQVHQRDIDTDFILTALKRIIRKFPKVRIILMSATIDNQLFRYYFASDHIDKFMKQDNFYKQIIQIQEYKKIKKALKQKQRIQNQQQDQGYFNYNQSQQSQDQDQDQQKKKIYQDVALNFLRSKFPCPTININEQSNYKRTYFYLDTLDKFVKKQYSKKWGQIEFSKKAAITHKQLFDMTCIILDQIKYNCKKKNSLSQQAVLIFMPGLAQIQSLNEYIITFFGGYQKIKKYFDFIHVHSTIMNDNVQKKLDQQNQRQIKVIIATNIAESSITVKGVKYIIDFCLTKQIRFNVKSRMENLELVWSSKASCKQRAGRTGRVCDGLIFRLVEKKFYEQSFDDYSQPQIKRSSLDKLILRIKLMHENDPMNFFKDPPQVLGTCIQPPKLQSIQSAINSLKFCGGLQQRGQQFLITQLGKLYVQIPIDISYSKMLLMSIVMGTYNDILILVSILSQNKNPFHRRQIDKHFIQFYEKIQNYQNCDLLALINLYKQQDEYRNPKQIKSQQGYEENRTIKQDKKLRFQIYTQTKNTINDIQRRITRYKNWFDFQQLNSYLNPPDYYKLSFKCRKPINQLSSLSKDYLFRFKLTLVFGFIDKFILIKPPMYQQKQQKRIKYMKKFNISNHNTIVLINSSVITKPYTQNRQSQERLIRHWKNIFKKSLRIDLKDITLGSGLSYLHFGQQKDLNKLLFIKYMDAIVKRKTVNNCILQQQISNKKVGKYSSTVKQQTITKNNSTYLSQNSSILTFKQILECLGDLDHMQQGIPVTYYKQNRLSIDITSLNRIININQDEQQRFLFTNSFMLQNNNSLTCRYTTHLRIPLMNNKKKTLYDPNIHIHSLFNLIFYPFVKLKPNKESSSYEYLILKKKYRIKIPYQMASSQIQEANFIRQVLKKFLENDQKIKINRKNCQDYYKFVKEFIYKKRKQTINQKEEQIWQNQFLRELKQNKIQKNQKDKFQKKKGLEIQLQSRCNVSNVNNLNQQIIQEINQNNVYQNEIRQIKQINNTKETYQNRNFMNPIQLPLISQEKSYFLRQKNQSNGEFKEKMKNYLNWKVQKLTQVQKLQRYAKDNETYLCCGQSNCILPLCKLKRIGQIADYLWRQLYEPIMQNIKISTQQFTQIDTFLEGQNIQRKYHKMMCSNDHEFGIRFQQQNKIKILIISSLTIKYPNGYIENAQFERLQLKYWQNKQKQKLAQKRKKSLSTSCWVCGCNILTNYDQLAKHMQQSYHQKSIQNFRKSIQRTRIDIEGDFKKEQQEQQQILQEKDLKKLKQNDLMKQIKQNQKENKKQNDQMEIQY